MQSPESNSQSANSPAESIARRQAEPMAKIDLDRSLKQARIQKWIGWALFPFSVVVIVALKWGRGYRIRDIKKHRAFYKELMKDPRPLMICCNHLSYLDPILLIYAFGNHWWYLRNFHALTWNVAASKYRNNPLFYIVCIIAKTLFIDREGSKASHYQMQQTVCELMKRGEPLTLFPEGRRTLTGRVDTGRLAYGTGKIVTMLKDCRVLCCYLRSETQLEAGGFPDRGSHFDLSYELVNFDGDHATSTPRVTQEIIGHIQRLENRWFASHQKNGSY